MISRSCPACRHRLSFLDVIGPAFRGTGMNVVCPNCGRTISRSWREYLWLPALGFPVGYFVPDMIVKYFGLEDWWVWPMLILVLLGVIYLLFVTVELRVQENGEGDVRQAAHDVVTRPVEVVIRPYSAWDKRLALFCLVAAVLALTFLANAWMQQAKYAFIVFVCLFVVFLVKRLQMQFAGQTVVLLQISPEYVEMAKLRTRPFFETEVAGQIRMRIDDIVRISAEMTPGGSAADPEYTIGFHLKGDRYLNNEIPFHLAESAYESVEMLKNNLPGVEFEIDERYRI